jgi:AmmeMemoRadiSam system protein A
MNKKILINIAKNSILEEFEKKEIINKKELIKKYPFLLEKRATFVTLKIDNQLRGCIGSILPKMSLIDDIIYNAKQAAFADPRFTPLTYEEFQKINIEISILTIPKLLEYKEKVEKKFIINDEEFDYLINAAGFESGIIDEKLQINRERFVEFKAAWKDRSRSTLTPKRCVSVSSPVVRKQAASRMEPKVVST